MLPRRVEIMRELELGLELFFGHEEAANVGKLQKIRNTELRKDAESAAAEGVQDAGLEMGEDGGKFVPTEDDGERNDCN